MNPPNAGLAARIATWLPRARWFAAKGGQLTGVAVADAAAIPGTDAWLALLDVRAAGDAGRYCVPVAAETGGDAAATPEFARWAVATILGGARAAGLRGRFVGRPVAGTGRGWPAPQDHVGVTPLGGDASNTSLAVEVDGRAVTLKLLRRCRPGPQPEVELGEFFAAADWRGTPALLGHLAYEPADGSAATVLATLHEFLPGCRTAWEVLGGLLAAGGLPGPRRAEILSLAATIGRLTGEMHAALASRPDAPGFAPQAPTAAACRAVAEAMAARGRGILARGAGRGAALPEAIARRLVALAAGDDLIVAGCAAVADPAATPAAIRVHGDYHLGQVLVREADGRAFAIDFEGEPARPLAERRGATSPAKDVAGMCRSFDYAVRHAARKGGPPYRREDVETLERGFLAAYEQVARGEAWWPADPAVAAAAIAAWKLDKAVYELGYELDNRPDWVEVPLAALEERLPLNR